MHLLEPRWPKILGIAFQRDIWLDTRQFDKQTGYVNGMALIDLPPIVLPCIDLASGWSNSHQMRTYACLKININILQFMASTVSKI